MTGSKVRFPDHFVVVVSCLESALESDGSGCYLVQYSGDDHQKTMTPRMSDYLKVGLDYTPGKKFRSEIKNRCGTTVHL